MVPVVLFDMCNLAVKSPQCGWVMVIAVDSRMSHLTGGGERGPSSENLSSKCRLCQISSWEHQLAHLCISGLEWRTCRFLCISFLCLMTYFASDWHQIFDLNVTDNAFQCSVRWIKWSRSVLCVLTHSSVLKFISTTIKPLKCLIVAVPPLLLQAMSRENCEVSTMNHKIANGWDFETVVNVNNGGNVNKLVHWRPLVIQCNCAHNMLVSYALTPFSRKFSIEWFSKVKSNIFHT